MDPPDEVCTTLRTPVLRAASASRTVPITLTDASNCGLATERRTSICAAKWNTTSGPVLVEDRVQIRGHDVRLDEDVRGIVGQMLEVGRATGREIVQSHHRVAVGQQTVD